MSPPGLAGTARIDESRYETEAAIVAKAAAHRRCSKSRHVDRFETELAAWAGFERAVVTSSETGAASVMIGALGLEPGDEIIVSPVIPAWLLFALLHAGLVPVFADFAPGRFTVATDAAEAKLTGRTRALLVALPFGHPEDMSTLHALAKAANVPLIFEISESLGASFRNKPAHSDVDIAVLSLREGHSALSTGEGGALFFRAPSLAEKAKSYARFSDLDGVHLGINQKLSEVQAALGRHRLEMLDATLALRQSRLAELAERVSRSGLVVIEPAVTSKRGTCVVAARTAALSAFGAQARPMSLAIDLPASRGMPVDCPQARSAARRWCGVALDPCGVEG